MVRSTVVPTRAARLPTSLREGTVHPLGDQAGGSLHDTSMSGGSDRYSSLGRPAPGGTTLRCSTEDVLAEIVRARRHQRHQRRRVDETGRVVCVHIGGEVVGCREAGELQAAGRARAG